jgi:hypothetical protein
MARTLLGWGEVESVKHPFYGRERKKARRIAKLRRNAIRDAQRRARA